MDRHPFMSAVLSLLLASSVYGQQMSERGAAGPERNTVASTTDTTDKAQQRLAGLPSKQELEDRIAFYERVVRGEESAHASDIAVGRIYEQLGLWYRDIALLDRSEADQKHAISLFRRASQSNEDLATSLGNLGSLHVEMGKLREGEKEELEAVRTRQDMNDPLLVAQSLSDLATVYLAQHKFEKAIDVAEQALAEFSTNERAAAVDRIFVRYALSLALCAAKSCSSAVPVMKAAIDEAKATMEPDDLRIGFGEFILGSVYLRLGDPAEALQYMRQGTSQMKEQLGWGHPMYLKALGQYAQLLRKSQRVEEAKVVEHEIRRTDAVVDVHSLQKQTSAFSFAGLR